MGLAHAVVGAVLLFAFILDIIAISTPGWIYTDTWAQGLFQNYSGDIIRDLDKGPAEKTAAAFLIMGGLLLFIGIIACMVGAAKETMKMVAKGGGGLALAAGIFFIIGTATYTGKHGDWVDQPNVWWGYSFGFAWTTAAICLLAAIPAIIF